MARWGTTSDPCRERLPPAAGDHAWHEAIAVVGISCRFPGTANADRFWELLRGGSDVVTAVPPERWDASTLPPATRRGGFLDRVDLFDADFFGISPREAAAMDPQQRLMLELCWEAA